MKIRLLLTVVGLAISFAVPTFAQQKDTVDPKIAQQIRVGTMKFDEAFNKNDAAAVATFYTEDAVMRGNTEHFTVGSVRSDLQRSLRHGFPLLFATGFIQDTDPVFSVFHPAVRLNMIPVFRSSLFSDSQIPWHRLRHELSRHGGQQKARSHCLSRSGQ